jgi:hypothetical protein
MTRWECILIPEHGKESRQGTVISQEPLQKGMTIKIKKTKWVVKLAIPAETGRPHIGDLISIPTRTKKK